MPSQADVGDRSDPARRLVAEVPHSLRDELRGCYAEVVVAWGYRPLAGTMKTLLHSVYD